ncbi:hypothetical protein EXN66_Car009657 [Channa argus]|uniref:Uncharacterized protein n=1 Tax=Channa argus TaxID=215402 RepID=A0A6G1PUG8_CHAAH|nr:hypothetical protein EXN66_Car009657 [Channa argus]
MKTLAATLPCASGSLWSKLVDSCCCFLLSWAPSEPPSMHTGPVLPGYSLDPGPHMPTGPVLPGSSLDPGPHMPTGPVLPGSSLVLPVSNSLAPCWSCDLHLITKSIPPSITQSISSHQQPHTHQKTKKKKKKLKIS